MGPSEPKTKCLLLVVKGCLQTSSKRHHQQGNSYNDIKDERIIVLQSYYQEVQCQSFLHFLEFFFALLLLYASYMYDLVHDMKAIHGNLF